MSKSSAKELLMDIRVERGDPAECANAGLALAARVEKVLALQPREWAGYDACLAEVRAILNGEE